MKGFDINKTNIMELIVGCALKLEKSNHNHKNIINLSDELPNVRVSSYISHAEIKQKLETNLKHDINIIEDEIN